MVARMVTRVKKLGQIDPLCDLVVLKVAKRLIYKLYDGKTGYIT